MRLAELADRRVAVWGYGREGRAALAALCARLEQPHITLFCTASEEAPARVFAAAAGAELDIVTAPPDAAALSAFDIVIKSPGISAYRPEVVEARHNGTRFTSGTALWFAEHPHARVIAVTGTKGKSTVSALIAHLLRALGRRTALAGNIGLPLLELLDVPQLPDAWVIELSSFQTRDAGAVEVGVVNNLYEEHLDWHGTRERYVADKLALAGVSQTLVTNARQNEPETRLAEHPHRVLFGGRAGWHVADGAVFRDQRRVFDLARSPLPGAHNAMNLCAALAAVETFGEDALTAVDSVESFRPLPHRLQRLGERDGLTWIDDSIATTPQATLEALASVGTASTSVLVGGYERGLGWSGFAGQVRDTPPRAVIALGANGARIEALLREYGGAYQLVRVATLAEAVLAARESTPQGGTVLLSPGAPSFDQFRDYAERGRAFAALAGFDPDDIGSIQGLGIA